MAVTYNNKSGFYNYSANGGTTKSNATDSYNTGKNNELLARTLQYTPTGNTGAAATSTAANGVLGSIQKGGSNGGNGSGNSGSTTTSSNGYDANYLADLYSSYAAQRQAQLQAAYDRQRENIENAFNESRGLLEDNYNSSRSALQSSYNNSYGKLQDDAAKSLKEAYVNKMLSNKNLNQQMSAAGLSGGASETTMASMLNNYGNARNNINTTLNSNISDLNATRDTNLATILQAYNSNLANLLQQRANALSTIESALSSGMGDALNQQFQFQTSSGYLNALQEAMNNMNAYQGVATQANNPVDLYNAQQVGVDSLANTTNYEYFQKLIQALTGK